MKIKYYVCNFHCFMDEMQTFHQLSFHFWRWQTIVIHNWRSFFKRKQMTKIKSTDFLFIFIVYR